MNRRLVGKKCGMVRVFDTDGSPVACTLIHVESNVVTQLKSKATDGYEAIQLATLKIETADPRTVEKRVSKPLLGHYKKASVAPRKHLHEMRVDDAGIYKIGQELTLSFFEGVTYVDVTGTSRGKGYQGVMKKYGFAGGPAAHGSGFHRHAGSTGMRSSPGRCLPGGPRPSHMGDEQVTVQSLRVVSMDIEKGLMIVEGAVPGAKNSLVVVSGAKKRLPSSAARRSN
jgi:large subunit ribosomal protein L3